MDKQLLSEAVARDTAEDPDVAVPTEDVDAWIAKQKDLGVKSIVCLLADEHLRLYASLEMSLIDYYRQAGFAVVHIPVRDHQKPPLSDDHLARIWTAYDSLPKPVLVHCSAGIDRTGSAITHIKHRIEMNP
jgi:protein-tyrosine phosphatase